MCHLLNETYDCPHTPRTIVPCASPTPCPPPLLQTRALVYPTSCPSCTGHTPLDAPTHDFWNSSDLSTHADAAARYATDLAHFMSACLAAYNPVSTPDDFLKYYLVLDGELRCREHGALPIDCGCGASGEGSWEYNLSYTLRSRTSQSATDAFLDNPVIAAAVAGSLRSEVISMVQQLQPADPNNIHPNLPPYPVSKCHLLSTSESSRRLDVSLSARDEALTQMRRAVAPLPHYVARPAEEAMRFRAQVAATFSLLAITDSGLSPIRADMVLSRLATLVLDPTFFPDVPPEFDDTRVQVGSLTSRMMDPDEGDPQGANPIADLHAQSTSIISTARDDHAAALEPLVPYAYAFDLATDPTQDRTNAPCPLSSCKRTRSPSPQAAHGDPAAYHTPRVKMRNCGHVLGHYCAFKQGMVDADFVEGEVMQSNCPACGAEGAMVKATGGTGVDGEVRRKRWAWPLDAARSGEMEAVWVTST